MPWSEDQTRKLTEFIKELGEIRKRISQLEDDLATFKSSGELRPNSTLEGGTSALGGAPFFPGSDKK
jgi:hypothetical protein